MENLKNELRKIAETPANRLTQADKNTIRDACKRLGVELKLRGRCAQCYADAAVECWRVLQAQTPASEADGRAYVLRKGVRVLFGGMPINEAMMTDDVARDLIARGFSKSYFERCE